jgi:sugar phosphate isomerase/epimerase
MIHIPSTRVFLLIAALSFSGWRTAPATPIPDEYKIGGFAVGCQAYTFKNFSAMEAIEKTAQAGGKIIEFYPNQTLSPEAPGVKFNHNSSEEQIQQIKAHLTKHNVHAANYGVVSGKDEAEWRKIFEFAKNMGMYAVTTEAVKDMDTLEKLAKEFDLRVGIHQHPRRPNNPEYKVWDPNYVLSVIQNRDRRIGACADTGHWATSGVKPLDAIKLLRGRIVSLHMKERSEIGEASRDIPFGAGVLQLKEILDELKAQNFAGNISIEYEANWDNSVPEVAQCIGFFRGYAGCAR